MSRGQSFAVHGKKAIKHRDGSATPAENPLPTFNFVIDQSKGHWSKYASIKKKADKRVRAAIQAAGLTPVDTPHTFHFVWYLKDRRTDGDNADHGAKYIFDGLVQTGIIPDDRVKYVGARTHMTECDPANPRVEVSMLPIEQRDLNYNHFEPHDSQLPS